MEIIPGVHRVDGVDLGQVYLYEEADRLTLIDAGMAGSSDRILAEIEAIGRRPKDLRQIVVTHHHPDHVGAIADLVERTNARVLAHTLDAPVVQGEASAEETQLSAAEERALEEISKNVIDAPPAKVDEELEDGDEIDIDGGGKIVHVPGHTAGSIALYLPKRRVLFTGDAAAGVGGVPIVGVFNVDPEETRRSFARLAELDFEVACFGHGPPLDRNAALAFRRAVEKLV